MRPGPFRASLTHTSDPSRYSATPGRTSIPVAVIHPLIGRDSNQNPDSWHTHPVQLTGGTGDSDFCIVGIGTSQGGIAMQGDQLRVNVAAEHAGFQVSDLDVAASFVVQGDNACWSGLAVMVLDTAAL